MCIRDRPNTYLCRLEGEDAARDDALAQKLTANAAVRQVRFTTKGLEDINQMLSSINYVCLLYTSRCV